MAASKNRLRLYRTFPYEIQKLRVNMDVTCYYCTFKANTPKDVIEHLVKDHRHKVLKIKCGSLANDGTTDVRDVSTITLRHHEFYKHIRQRGKRGDISKPDCPVRRPLTVREIHRVHESKILNHVRRGLKLDT